LSFCYLPIKYAAITPGLLLVYNIAFYGLPYELFSAAAG